MAELRRDPVVGRWVIVNTQDPMAPDAFIKEKHILKQANTCQFCYGREYTTPPEIEAVRPFDTKPNSPGWSVRVFPNKFPALKIEGQLDKRGVGIFDITNGIGAHEVLIETPAHDKHLADLSLSEMADVIKKYQSRSVSLARDKRFKYILIFKNFGETAGASIEHGHSQIIALPMVPKYVLEELGGARHYFEYRGRCIFCDIIQQEYQDKNRIVTENDDFISFCPFVSRYPFECWILPKKHSPQFADMSEGMSIHCAEILKDVLKRIKNCLTNPSYNFFLHTSPVNYDAQEGYHWHIEIVPKLTREAGFEWGTGFYIVPTAPHVAAEYLRGVNLT